MFVCFLGSVWVNECCVKSVHASETKFNAAKTHFTHIKISFKRTFKTVHTIFKWFHVLKQKVQKFFVPSCGTYTKIKGYYMQSDWIKLGGVSGPTATSYECMLCFQSLKVELFFSNTSLICIKEPFSSIYPILFKVCVLCLNVCHSQKGL